MYSSIISIIEIISNSIMEILHVHYRALKRKITAIQHANAAIISSGPFIIDYYIVVVFYIVHHALNQSPCLCLYMHIYI